MTEGNNIVEAYKTIHSKERRENQIFSPSSETVSSDDSSFHSESQ